jgi:hypothetical protein
VHKKETEIRLSLKKFLSQLEIIPKEEITDLIQAADMQNPSRIFLGPE